MEISRLKTRKYLFQKLFSYTYIKIDDDLFNESFLKDDIRDKLDFEYIKEIFSIIIDKESYFIEVLKKYAPKFDVKNMNLIYVLPTFIGLAEMFFLKEEISAKISIAEAVKLSKTYGDKSSASIVNGVLNNVMKNHDEISLDFQNNDYKSDFSFFKK